MGSAQLFSLRWNNYSHHITNALDDLRAEDELTDVTLCAEGNKIRAHKLLLSACSTFFRETFRENPCQHPVIILKGVSFTDLQAVVTFMYNGQVNVTQERLSCFLQTAEMLQIKGLTDMNDNKHDNHELDVPLRGVGGHVNSNHTSSKKRMNNVDSRLHAFPETLQQQQQQQRPPTPKRRKFIPSAPSAGQGDTNAAGNAYNNSPGPSGPSAAVNNNSGGGGEGTDVVTAATAAGQTALQSAITNTDSNSADDDYDGGVDGSAVGLAGMLKYEHDLQDDGDGGDGLLGDDEDEYRNNLSEDGDNSMLDYTNMEQGAIGVVGWMEEGEDFRIGLTQTGSQVLLHQGYLYQVERSQASKVYWRCRNRRGKCRGRAIKIGSHVQITQQHITKLVSPTNSNSLFIQEENDDPLESDPFQINIVCEDDGAGGKTWECHSCTKSFTLRCNLLAHMKQHLGNTGCSFCGKVLSTVGNLKKHLRNAHGVGASNSTPTHPEASYQYQQQ
ncbi:Longitudinals lacking protein-like [Folsomia candida]|uniref:Longitudinals lacking protein-like n=1 Tax=Folsomia candida TaxID=158441 RepID=A0A226F1B2_FOLCA|nr:Longitudinals lacking protein-like [Folsomia candida]